jgi:riboflavin synthase alpha subunit
MIGSISSFRRDNQVYRFAVEEGYVSGDGYSLPFLLAFKPADDFFILHIIQQKITNIFLVKEHFPLI